MIQEQRKPKMYIDMEFNLSIYFMIFRIG